jgi:signal transduction histidine kinase
MPELGRKGYFESTHFPLRDSQGNIIGGMGVIHDITERVRMEEQLRHATKLEAVGQLAGGIAHDFNNSLKGINRHCSLALGALGKNTELTRKYLQRILDACERATDSVRRFLAFGRRQVQEIKVVNLNGVLREFAAMLRRLVGEDIEFSVEPAEDLGNARVDVGQIEEAVINLVTNARDAMPEGGKLVLKSANVTLDEEFIKTHRGSAPGEYVMLSVTDNGRGMSKDTLARVFEPFFTTKEKDKGNGLGLSMVYGIVKQSGGYTLVESGKGLGTTVKIYLPRAYEPAEVVESTLEEKAALHR